MVIGPKMASFVSKEIFVSVSKKNPKGAIEGREFEKAMLKKLRPEALQKA